MKTIRFMLFLFFAISCVSSREGQVMRDDVFSLQVRLNQLESSMNEKAEALKSGNQNTNQRAASTATRLDAIEQELKRAKGDVDALKVGVRTGKMPGEQEWGADSIGQKLEDLQLRLETLEMNQQEILNAIEKGTGKKIERKKSEVSPDSKNSDGAYAKNLKGMKSAFADKDYAFVGEYGEKIVKEQSRKDDILEANYIFGESLMKLGDYKKAAVIFSDYLDSSPAKDKVPLVKMKIGDCFRQMGDKVTAKLFYQELAAKYANTPEGGEASKKLKSLEGT